MTIQNYIDNLNTRFKTGISREHSYRGDLQNLLSAIVTDVLITNEPARVACGAPDYIITKKNIPVGYIEAKDIGVDLNSKSYKEQFERYKQSLNNLIITDYLTFQLFRDSELVLTISIGQINGNKIVGNPENYQEFLDLIKDFCTHAGQTIKSSSKLSKMMAGKARLLANVIENALLPDETDNEFSEPKNNSLIAQYNSFKQILIHDITEKTFADIYAQTIAYGMFAARLHDTSLDDFSRQEAAELIPKSNPFLRKLFQYIAGYDLDDRIKWIVDALADIFRATNVAELLKDFGKSTQQNDPIIHFYETFLSEYDPALRKSRGVWYTPAPVVNFIVRAVDDILKSEFGLSQGLADTTKTKIKVDLQGKKVEKEVHKVQILDPATGTGTFLAEVVTKIYRQFEGQQGIWNNYVEEHLIPRLNGFEILMASYAMAHLKLDLLLHETGFKATKDQRFKIYLTNSLEEHHPDTGTLFANWLSTEANEANHIKRDTPVMVILGNPPYSISSSNKGNWIQNLIADYKKNLNEKKINLDDDYIKFIRYGQHFIDKNGSGILAYISNNSFIDGITHRQMRKHLLESFDKIYILDLHGNAKKKEECPDGSPDQNVFDIMQGVSINIFIKTGKKKKNEFGELFHNEIHGTRDYKYQELLNSNIKSIQWKNIEKIKPNLFFVSKNFSESNNYQKGFYTKDLFSIYNSGIKTDRDSLFIEFEKNKLSKRIEMLLGGNYDSNFSNEFRIEDSGSYKLTERIKNKIFSENYLKQYDFRPFDKRFIYYDAELISRPASKVMFNLFNPNYTILLPRQSITGTLGFFISKILCDVNFTGQAGQYGAGLVFPLYLYPVSSNKQEIFEQNNERIPNLKAEIIEQIAENLGLTFTNEKETTENTFAPIDILDYIYAFLHSPSYREKYKEFLKIDFPRVPYPKDQETFWKFVKLGSELRQIHLLESPIVEKRITTYPQTGTNTVDKPRFEIGKVWINDEQYFEGVPEISWEFYIGGYQPAQKWLKDRKGRQLSFEEILHYQKIIVALNETDRIMKEIDNIEFEKSFRSKAQKK